MVDFVKEVTDPGGRHKREINFALAVKKNEAVMNEALAGIVGQKELGKSGLDDLGLRFDLARADTIGEKLKLFKKKFPEGELIAAPAGGELLFRRNKAEPFSTVEGTNFEPLNDVVDFLGGDLGPILGEIGAAAITKGRSQAAPNLLKTLSTMFVGGAAGEFGEQQIQSLEGIQEETLSEQGERAVGAGTVSMVGAGAGRALGSMVDAARGGGFIGLKPGASDAIQAANRLSQETGINFPGFTPGQVSDTPLIQKIEGQSGATMPTVGRWFAEQNASARNMVDILRNPGRISSVKNSLSTLHEQEKNRLLSTLIRDAKSNKEGGLAVKRGIESYERTSAGVVNRLYDDARAIETPKFDISELQELANNLVRGNRVPLPDNDAGEMVIGNPIHNDLMVTLNQIRSLDPELAPGVTANGERFEATDQLRYIQQTLWDFFNHPPGTVVNAEQRANARVARELHAGIRNVLDNPINPNPAFVDAWTRARTEAAKRFDTLEKSLILKASKEEHPNRLAERLIGKNNETELDLIRSVIPNSDYKIIQDTFKRKLLDDADNITKILNDYDKETLSRLLTPAELTQMRHIGTQIDKLNSIGIQKTFERQSRIGAAVKELLFTNQTSKIDRLADLASNNPQVMTDIRAGLMESIWNSVNTPNGLNARALKQTLNDLRDGGIDRFLNASDMRILRDLDLIMPFMRTSGDAGTSIQAGALVENVRDVLHGSLEMDTIHTILEHLSVGAAFTNPKVQSFLLGRRRINSSKESLSFISAVLATVLTPNQQSGDLSFNNRLKAAP